MLRWIKLAVILLFAAAIVYFSLDKINETLIKDIKVVNLKKLYEEKGFPVYAKKIVRQKTGIFIKDIALVKNKNSKRSFSAYISRDLYTQVRVGSIVFLPNDHYTADPGAYIIGKVTQVSNTIDWQTGFYKVVVTMPIDVPDKTFYSAKIVYFQMANIIMVPIQHLEVTNNNYYAWTVKDNKTSRVNIKAGVCDGYSCEVISGLKVSDMLITSDLKLLKDGLFVNVVNDNATQDIISFTSTEGALK